MAAPTTQNPTGGGGALKFPVVVAGFTDAGADADGTALNGDYERNLDPGADQGTWFGVGVESDNTIDYQTDRWIIYGEYGVTTSENKAELVTDDDCDPRGTYTGLGMQVGDTVTVTLAPPTTQTP